MIYRGGGSWKRLEILGSVSKVELRDDTRGTR